MWFWSILLFGSAVAAVALTVMGPESPPDAQQAAAMSLPSARPDQQPADQPAQDPHMARCLMATEDRSLCERLAATLDPSATDPTAPGSVTGDAPGATDAVPAIPKLDPAPEPTAPRNIPPAPLPPQAEEVQSLPPPAETRRPPSRRGHSRPARRTREEVPNYSYGGVY